VRLAAVPQVRRGGVTRKDPFMMHAAHSAPAEAAIPDLDSEFAALDRVLAARHSCRGFRPEPVPRPIIEKMLRAAQRTASWCNAQPWHLLITSGGATERFRRGLMEHVATAAPQPDFPFPREYRGVYLQRRRECGFQLYDSVGIARGDRDASGRQARENFRLFGAPHVAIVTTDEALGIYGVLDCGAYVSTFMLAAASLGVASIAQASIAAQAGFVRAHFGIPEDRRIVCAVSFGYEDAEHPANAFRTSRAAPHEAVTWCDG
jgi:nitroreductase